MNGAFSAWLFFSKLYGNSRMIRTNKMEVEMTEVRQKIASLQAKIKPFVDNPTQDNVLQDGSWVQLVEEAFDLFNQFLDPSEQVVWERRLQEQLQQLQRPKSR
jgi:hypothetical protein